MDASSDNETLDMHSADGPSYAGPPHDSFPGYRIVREVHRGGQGVVYQAVQSSTRRKVAIKVMKEGPFAGPADRARFDREIQILGQLSHPRVITIHDTGVAAGCHFFVMDYISGPPLDEFLRTSRQPIEAILRLFISICDAVNAAHLHGVIHRDLKPSNIRVDAEGQPHVLDFGLAKMATSGASITAMTMTGQFVGSLPWASPEQASGVTGGIDVRTDVYSLGVILFQMLTSKFPYDVGGSMRRVLDQIVNTPPVRPSTIRRQINDELDNIALKCLAKERERRYQTAGEVARDVSRYLAGEPIDAKRDSAWYVLRKSLRRYRVPVGVLAAFVVFITGSAIALYFQVERARVAEARATAEATRAESEAQSAKQVTQTLIEFFAEDDPSSRQLMQELTPAKLLERGERIAATNLAMQPRERAAVFSAIARSYQGFGSLEEAERLFAESLNTRRRVLGEDHADTYDSLSDVARLRYIQDRLGEAEALDRGTLAGRQRLLGDDHADTLASMNQLAIVLHAQGKLTEAEKLYRATMGGRARTLGVEHPATLEVMNQLAQALDAQGQREEAEPLFQKVMEARRRVLGDDHPDTLASMNEIAYLSFVKGHYAEAEQLVRTVLTSRRRVLGDRHTETAALTSNLAQLLMVQQKFAEAEQLQRDAVAIMQDIHGPHHRYVARQEEQLAVILRKAGKFNEAERTARRVLEIQRKRRSDGHPELTAAQVLVAQVLTDKGTHPEAEALLLEAMAGIDAQTEPSKRARLRCLRALVALYEAWGKPDDASRWQDRLALADQAE